MQLVLDISIFFRSGARVKPGTLQTNGSQSIKSATAPGIAHKASVVPCFHFFLFNSLETLSNRHNR
jgi:hypothetical protein